MTQQRGLFDRFRARGEEVIARLSNELMENPNFVRAMQATIRGKEFVDQAAARALKSMNVPTRTEFKRVLSRLESLEDQVAALRQKAEAKPRARRRTPRRRKAAPAAESPKTPSGAE